MVLFVDLKSGSNLICEYAINHQGKVIKWSLKNNATHKSFIFNAEMHKIEKKL